MIEQDALIFMCQNDSTKYTPHSVLPQIPLQWKAMTLCGDILFIQISLPEEQREGLATRDL